MEADEMAHFGDASVTLCALLPFTRCACVARGGVMKFGDVAPGVQGLLLSLSRAPSPQ